MSKVVIANSIGIDSEGNYLIPYPSRWTASVKRSPFIFYPWELAYLSSLLKENTDHEVKFLDGCLYRWDYSTYREKIIKENPQWLIIESSSRTIEEDRKLAAEVKKECNTKLIFCGQHPSVYPEEVLQDADYVCQGEYEFTVLELLKGKGPRMIDGLYPNKRRELLDVTMLPWPEDSDVKRIDYGLTPLPGCRYLQIQMYATRGCPLGCNYCVCAHVYYQKPNWRCREISDIIAEVKYLKDKYPQMEGIFFDEEFHNAHKKFILALCNALIKNGFHNFKNTSMGAYYTLDREIMEAMKEAGYYQLRFGIETASEAVAKKIGLGPKYNLKKLLEILKIGNEIGLEMYGTFTMGSLGATREDDLKTIQLIKELLKDGLLKEMQVSVCTPQPGTPFFKEAEQKGYLVTNDWRAFDGSIGAVLSMPWYSKQDIDKMHQLAVDTGHYYRGLYQLKSQGFFSIATRAVKRVGIIGIIKHFIRRLTNRHILNKI
ncbi:MAG: B12-binding domain-containing radical SAM protein [bacterium]